MVSFPDSSEAKACRLFELHRYNLLHRECCYLSCLFSCYDTSVLIDTYYLYIFVEYTIVYNSLIHAYNVVCVRVCDLCMKMGMCVHDTWVEVKGQSLSSVFTSHYVWISVFLSLLPPHIHLASWPREFPFFVSHLDVGAQRLKMCTTTSSFTQVLRTWI